MQQTLATACRWLLSKSNTSATRRRSKYSCSLSTYSKGFLLCCRRGQHSQGLKRAALVQAKMPIQVPHVQAQPSAYNTDRRKAKSPCTWLT